MTTDEKRMALLNQVIMAENGFQAAIKELSNYNWDYDGAPAILDKRSIKDVLDRYTRGKLSPKLVQEWADFLELRDDIDYPEKDEDIIAEVLHALANPQIEGVLTVERAKFFLNQL